MNTDVVESEGDVCLRVNPRDSQQAAELHRKLYEWQAAANALRKGEITHNFGSVFVVMNAALLLRLKDTDSGN